MTGIGAKYRTPHVRPHAASVRNRSLFFLMSVVSRHFGASLIASRPPSKTRDPGGPRGHTAVRPRGNTSNCTFTTSPTRLRVFFCFWENSRENLASLDLLFSSRQTVKLMALLRGVFFGMLIALQFAVHAGCFLVPLLSSPCTSQRKSPLTSVLRMRDNEFSIPGGGMVGMLGIVSAGVLLAGSPVRPAFAERSGFEIFTQKCANCHKSGGNSVVGENL
jgi:hypothetical protein